MTVSDNGVVEWIPKEGVHGDVEFELEIIDDGFPFSEKAYQRVRVNVTPINDSPIITTENLPVYYEGIDYEYQIEYLDPDDTNNGNDLSWELITSNSNITLSNTGLLSFINDGGASSSKFIVKLSDGGENSSETSFAYYEILNAIPELYSGYIS